MRYQSTLLNLLDIPAFPGDNAAQGTLRLAASGLASGWTGTAIYRSDNGGADYNFLANLTTVATMGTASTALASGPTCVFDEVNTVTVLLLGSGQLQSASELAVLNGANAALIGNEIIQFTTATLVSPGEYTLSGLLRGRLGTEWAVSGHAAGESFVLLDGSVGKQIVANNMIGLLREYKPVTFNDSVSSTAEQDFTYAGIGLKPYSPVHITGARDISGNLTIDWIRRTRLGGEWQDYIDVPLNEASEAYEIDIMNGSNVARTISGITNPAASYSATDQTTDFGSPQSSLTLNIYQISGIVGRGYAGNATV